METKSSLQLVLTFSYFLHSRALLILKEYTWIALVMTLFAHQYLWIDYVLEATINHDDSDAEFITLGDT